MSDMTPRRLSASLIERAAEVYDFARYLTPAPAASEPESEPAPEPIIEVAPKPIASLAPEPLHAPTLDPAAPIAIDRRMLAEKGLLVPGAPIGALTEEFRLVKRQLIATARTVYGEKGEIARTVLVGSAQPGDGKTYCAVNLAISLAAERDIDVLLADADFAKPNVLSRLGHEERIGLLDALGDETIDIESCIVPTDIPRLSLLPAGTKSHDDTELLASGRTGELVAQLLAANPNRLIVFDTPPVLAASPASVLAGHVGQVVLVVRADRTSESDLREAVTLLDSCDHIQLLLNAVSFKPGGRRYGSYYGQEEAA